MSKVGYKVLVASTEEVLEEYVTDLMIEGWSPQGGLQVTFRQPDYTEDGKFLFSQAMVYYGD